MVFIVPGKELHFIKKEELFTPIREKYDELKKAFKGTDIGNALEFDEAVAFGKGLNILALCDYMITVGKNTRRILENLTLEQIQSMVKECVRFSPDKFICSEHSNFRRRGFYINFEKSLIKN